MQAVELYSQFTDPLAACERLGTALAKSGLFGCDRSEQGQALMLICMSERKSPTEILRNFDIVEGRLRKKALAMLADFRARGGRHQWLATGDDGREAALKLTLDGQEITVRFSIADAQRQGLVKPRSAWEKTPGNMLRARCISNGVAMLCPEIVAGSEDDGEAVTSPGPALNLTPTASVGTATALPAPAIDVPAKVSRAEPPADAPVLADAGLAPAPSPTTASPASVQTAAEPADKAAPAPEAGTPLTPVAAPPVSSGGYATPAQVAKLQEIIGDAHFDRAMAWMVKEGWLKTGESMFRLTETRANRVIKQSASWLRAIGATEGAAK